MGRGAGRGTGWAGVGAVGAAALGWSLQQHSRLGLLAKEVEQEQVLTPEEIEYDNRVRQYKQPYQVCVRYSGINGDRTRNRVENGNNDVDVWYPGV